MIHRIILLLAKDEFKFAKRFEQTYSVSHSMTNLSLTATNGKVNVVPGKPGQIVVKQLVRADDVAKLDETALKSEIKPSGLSCKMADDFKTPGKPSSRYPGAVDYAPPVIEITVTVPPDLNLEIDTTNASITIGRVAGKIIVRTSNGDIRYQSCTSNAESTNAKSRNGAVQSEIPINTAKSPRVSVESYNGNIFIEKPLPIQRIHNAAFWNGKTFEPNTWYIMDGRFAKSTDHPTTADISRPGMFVAPAYGDAHCHHIDGEYLTGKMNTDYIAQGTLYVQSMGNHSSSRKDSEKIVNKPGSIDVAFANAGFTSGWGHPAFLYENLGAPADPKMTPTQRSDFIKSRPRTQLGDSYWLAETPDQLEKVWPRYLASDPDLTKIFLVNTAQRSENIDGLAGSIGLSPEIAEAVIKKAHASGLKVYAHVDTKTDVEICLKAGVDGLAHMPGYGMGSSTNPDYLLAGLRTKKRQKLVVQPTTSLAADYSQGEELARVKEVQRGNLATLRGKGATFVIGSDLFFATQKAEALDWLQLGFTPQDVFRSLVTTTPQSIFPSRAIGEIREGYEANFVVLAVNPVTNLDKAFAPACVYKAGTRLL